MALTLVESDRPGIATHDRWHPDRRKAMTQLCRLFPTLHEAPVDPWSADRFIAWALLYGHGSGSAHAARFVLGVWNSTADWPAVALEATAEDRDPTIYRALVEIRAQVAADYREDKGRPPTEDELRERVAAWVSVLGPFRFLDAVATWDDEHRRAVRAWLASPFWP